MKVPLFELNLSLPVRAPEGKSSAQTMAPLGSQKVPLFELNFALPVRGERRWRR